MNDSLRAMIRRARRSGRPTEQRPETHPLEQRAADAVRLARLATAVHMEQAVSTGGLQQPDDALGSQRSACDPAHASIAWED